MTGFLDDRIPRPREEEWSVSDAAAAARAAAQEDVKDVSEKVGESLSARAKELTEMLDR